MRPNIIRRSVNGSSTTSLRFVRMGRRGCTSSNANNVYRNEIGSKVQYSYVNVKGMVVRSIQTLQLRSIPQFSSQFLCSTNGMYGSVCVWNRIDSIISNSIKLFQMYAISWHTNLASRLGDLEILILLVSCICHDLDHPGYNNIYQINARTELALRLIFYILNEFDCRRSLLIMFYFRTGTMTYLHQKIIIVRSHFGFQKIPTVIFLRTSARRSLSKYFNQIIVLVYIC